MLRIGRGVERSLSPGRGRAWSALCALLIVAAVAALIAAGAVIGFAVALAAAAAGLTGSLRTTAPQPVEPAVVPPATPAPEEAAAATSEPPPAAEPFAISRAQLRAGSTAAQMRESASKLEAALAYHMDLEAREWAEDAIRFLRAGDLIEGAKALDAARQLAQHANPLAQHYLYEARRALTGDTR